MAAQKREMSRRIGCGDSARPSLSGTVARRALLTLATTVLAIAYTACSSSTTQPTPTTVPPPVPLTASASILESNSLIALVEGTLDAPGQVYVEYWDRETNRLRTQAVASAGTAYSVYVARLRPATDYSYIVLGTNSEGQIASGPKGTFVTGELPEGLRKASFDVLSGSPTLDVTYLEFRQAGFMGLAAIDGQGHIVWYFEPPEGEQPYVMARKHNGNIVYIAGHKGGTTGMGLVEITPLGEEVDRLVDECSPFGPIHHEIQVLRDGRIMYLSRDVRRPGYGDPPMPQEGDTIGIWDQANRVNRIVWNIFDFISPAERTVPDSNRTLPGNPVWGGCERDGTVQDWSHGESLSMAEDGSVLASFRHLNQIVSIAPDFKTIRWRLGGPGSDFTFPDTTDRFYHQHSVVALPNGNILMFDNGNYRPDEEGKEYSRGVELSLDLDAMTATKVWEYRHSPDIFSLCCSSVDRLANGNTVVMFGSIPGDLCCRPYYIVEADAQSEVVWEVEHVSPRKTTQQRVYPSESIMGERRP